MEDTNKQSESKEITINVDKQTAFNLKVLEYDKLICDSEAVTADLKKQRMSFIFDTNIQLIQEKSKEEGK